MVGFQYNNNIPNFDYKNPHSQMTTMGQNGEENVNNKERIIATVQIDDQAPVKVMLKEDFSTVADHARYLLMKINVSRGKVLGLRLTGRVELAAIFVDNVAMLDHAERLRLDPDAACTFHFENATSESEAKDAEMKSLTEKLNKRHGEEMKKLRDEQAKKLAAQQGRLEQLQKEKEESKKVELEHAKMVEMQQSQLEQLGKYRDTLNQRVEHMERGLVNMEAQSPVLVRFEKHLCSADCRYAHLIRMPNVDNLRGHYDRDKLLDLIQNGNIITDSLYIQENQGMDDPDIVHAIVELLATAEEPGKLIGHVAIEYWHSFDWPKRAELALKEDRQNVTLTFNEASGSGDKLFAYHLAEYELVNGASRFLVSIYYSDEYDFNIYGKKFIYRRLA